MILTYNSMLCRWFFSLRVDRVGPADYTEGQDGLNERVDDLLLTTKEFSFLIRYIPWWLFFRIALVLEENLRWPSRMVSRYLFSVTISAGVP